MFPREVFKAMASECEIQLYADETVQVGHAIASAIAEVRRIERAYSRYLPDNMVSRINHMAGRRAVAVDPETTALIAHAAACHEISAGMFDITSGVLRKIWDFRRNVVPTPAAIEAILPLIGWHQVEWNGMETRLPHAGMEIDFGGIGKEFAVDQASAVLHAEGVVHAIVNLGGDVRALGPHADGTPGTSISFIHAGPARSSRRCTWHAVH